MQDPHIRRSAGYISVGRRDQHTTSRARSSSFVSS